MYKPINEKQKQGLKFSVSLLSKGMTEEQFWCWLNLWHSERRLFRDEQFCNDMCEFYFGKKLYCE